MNTSTQFYASHSLSVSGSGSVNRRIQYIHGSVQPRSKHYRRSRTLTARFTKLLAEPILALPGTIPVEQKKISYSAIHKAAGLTVPGRSMILTGTIPMEQKSVHLLSMGAASRTTSGGHSSCRFFGNGQ